MADSTQDDKPGAIGLAERLLALLDMGAFTATYKYAVLLGLLDCCLERTTADGRAPDVITTYRLAVKVTELYWPHSLPYQGGSVLKQNGGHPDSQASIITAIRRFRERHAPDSSAPLSQARQTARRAFERLLHEVEWILIQMPLPRLQVVGNTVDPFLYNINWGPDVKRRAIAEYQRGARGAFDPTIRLAPQVGEHLVALNGLLRPLVQQQWTRKVAHLNRLAESRLEAFLFGTERISTEPLRATLQALQENRCFYCAGVLDRSPRTRPQVDHFIPWVRYPTNAVETLVVAHEGCNLHKRDFLAEPTHVHRWRKLMTQQAGAMTQLAEETRWEHHPPETENVARAIYFHLPAGSRLWTHGTAFTSLDRGAVLAAFQ